jgi:hypothetical protein
MSHDKPTDIPLWLTDPEGIGPCPCGEPLYPSQPYIILEGGPMGKRKFHIPCAHIIMMEDDSYE